MKTKILSKVLIIVLIAVVVFWGAGLYYYLPISNIKLPDDAKTIKLEIYISDIYGLHVCAEKVVESELEYEQLKEYIEDNNKNDNIHIYLIYKESNRYVVWWDDYSISLVNSIDGIEKEGMNYYLITNNTPYGSFFIELLNRMDIRVILSEVGVFIGETNLKFVESMNEDI